MTNTIDKRVVEMGFDNKQFENGVQTSIKSINNLKNGLNFSGIGNGLSGISEGIKNISSHFNALGAVGFTVLQNLTNTLMGFASKAFEAALGIKSMKEGFSSYEVKVNAVKTVMAGTGESIDQVTQSLDELNAYSDRTVYSFQDMTENISKFTNAGLSSKDAATAIQGISNVAAISGANTGEAARAMYNFGQAMQQGAVRLMDWKSIENANMATIGFKQQLIDTAVAMGMLKKQADGTYKTLSGEVLTATKNFNGSLEKEWLTTKVLTQTLADYASQTTEIGKKANAAAQEVTTFSQMMATAQDSLKTGWTKTWQIVFGDLFQAKALFTEISNIMGGFISKNAESRNTLLQSWKAFGGRQAAIDALRNTFEGLLSIIKPIQTAFTTIFPPTTGYQLASITWAIKEFTEKLTISKDTADKLHRTFFGVAAVIDLVWTGVRESVKWLGKLVGAAAPAGGSILDFTARLGDWLLEARNFLRFQDGFTKIFEKIKSAIAPVDGILYRVIDRFGKFNALVREGFTPIEAVGEILKTFLPESFVSVIDKICTSLDGLFNRISKISFGKNLEGRFSPLTKLFEGLGNVLGWFGKVIEKLSPLLFKLGSVFASAMGDLGNAILDSLDNLDYNKIFDALNSGLLAALLIAIKKFVTKGSGTLDGISGILDGVKGSLEAWQSSLKSKTLMTIASAIAILAISVIALSMVDSAKLTKSLTAITVMFAQLMTAMNMFSKIPGTGGVSTIAAQMVILSAAVLILSFAVAKLSKLDTKGLMKGLASVGVVLTELSLFMKTTNLNGMGAAKGAGLLLLAISLNVLAKAVEKFAMMDAGKMTQGLIAVGAILGEIGVFSRISGNGLNTMATAAALVVIAGSMIIFSKAVEKMGNLSWDQIGKGLVTMGGSLLIIAGAMRIMPKNMIITGVALVAVAAALKIMSGALKTMGGMSWDEIARGLALLGGTMLILVVGLNAMTTALPGAAAMLVMAAAMTIFTPALKSLGAMSLTEIGTGLLALAGSFAVIGVAGLVLGPLTPVLISLSAAMVLFGLACLAVGAGTLAFSAGLAALAVSGTAGAVALQAIVLSLISLIPMIAKRLAEGIIDFARTIGDGAPVLAESIGKVVHELVKTLVELIPEFVDAALKLLTSLLETLAENLPKIVKAGVDVVLALLKGISDNVGKIVAGAVAIVTEFLKALGLELPKIVSAGYQMLISLLNGLSDAIDKNSKALSDAAIKLAGAIINAVVGAIKDGASAIGAALWGLIQGALASLFSGITGGGSPAPDIAKDAGTDLGKDIGQGIANGLTDTSDMIAVSTKKATNAAIMSISDVISKISNALSVNMDVSPTIRPVIDLGDVISGAKMIDKLFDGRNLNIAGTLSKVSGISTGLSTSKVGDNLINQPNTPSTFSFTQINNSPVALSRIDIYRQTRNQLAALKGLVQSA